MYIYKEELYCLAKVAIQLTAFSGIVTVVALSILHHKRKSASEKRTLLYLIIGISILYLLMIAFCFSALLKLK